MKALSVHPYYAMAIATGMKTVEVRTWKTEYRGELVICSTAKKQHGAISSHALCTVKLIDCVPLTKDHLEAAMLRRSEYRPDLYAWILDDNRLIVPEYVKGKLSLWEYGKPVVYISEEEWVEGMGENQDWYERYWEPITT